MLEQINYPNDIKNKTIKEKKQIAEEIRQLILNTVSKTGGHLASNLGVVELTIALHSVLNTPEDKIVWDVGHQTYVHKILTGRKEQMPTLRQKDGLAGFPKVTESEYDNRQNDKNGDVQIANTGDYDAGEDGLITSGNSDDQILTDSIDDLPMSEIASLVEPAPNAYDQTRTVIKACNTCYKFLKEYLKWKVT